MRTAIRTKGRQRQVSTVQSVPAPIGGWNTRDPLAQMPPEDAVELTNWFPTPSDCEIRGGSAVHTSFGPVGQIETLAVHTAMDGTEEMFAVTDTDGYNVSVPGGSTGLGQSWSSQTDGKYQWTNMGDGTSNWLIMFNGVDSPKYYNGETWTEVTGITSPALTGISPKTAISPCVYHGRLYLVQKNSLSFWYLPAGAVGGLAVEFDLSPFANRGGYIMWAATWTFDAGDGMDDYIVFMTSEGEALVYTGTDPGSAVLWARIGTYFLGKPLGRRSFIQYGGELLAITQEGVFNMSDGLKYARINERVAVTDKIKQSFNLAAVTVGSKFGWEATLYPLMNAILFNIPLNGESEQYVVNTITGAWCRFTGWDSKVFVMYNNELYTDVYINGFYWGVTKAWTGRNDYEFTGNVAITATGQCAFNSFGEDSQSKQVKLFRTMLRVNGEVTYLTDVDVDFQDTEITGSGGFKPTSVGVWDTGLWDDAVWAGSLQTVIQWTSPDANVGYYISGKLQIETSTTIVHWVSNDYVLEQGGILS